MFLLFYDVGCKLPGDVLFAMGEYDSHAKRLVEVCSQMLGAIYGAVLPACASERYHEILESA